MRQEFIDLMNAIQEYRCHMANCNNTGDMVDIIRERRILMAQIDSTWRAGKITRMQRETLDGILEGERDDE